MINRIIEIVNWSQKFLICKINVYKSKTHSLNTKSREKGGKKKKASDTIKKDGKKKTARNKKGTKEDLASNVFVN